ncbi:MAG: aspartate-semialdehyde dehydrogenase [Candidatus Neomarinimicrobiota bacterium]
MKKHRIPVSVLGATGMVGQNYLRLLADHPWFEVVDVAASDRSAGRNYADVVAGAWYPPTAIPERIAGLTVRDVRDFAAIPAGTAAIFSAAELPDKASTAELEFEYARAGYPLISNSSANRWTPDVPMLIPEINPGHSAVIPLQQARRHLPATGFVAVKPNCSIQSYLVTLTALELAGYPVERVQVTTLQALSGAGQRGLNDQALRENVVPYIPGEEEKTEREPLKILGRVGENGIVVAGGPLIDATCTRVSVVDGHLAVVRVGFRDKIPSRETVIRVWREFRGEPQRLKLPLAPPELIIYRDEDDRPQPRLDRDTGRGMAVTAGRLQPDKFFDLKYVALSHNTVRGAAGGAILAAELLVAQGFIGGR